jgi:hypothetical protein
LSVELEPPRKTPDVIARIRAAIAQSVVFRCVDPAVDPTDLARSGLSEEQRIQVFDAMREVRVTAGQCVFNQGARLRAATIARDGCVIARPCPP